jgi:hypothetical protein
MKIRVISGIMYLLRMYVIVTAPTWKRLVLDENVFQRDAVLQTAIRGLMFDNPNDNLDCQ